MKDIEITAKTIEEAVQRAAEQLEVDESELDIEVVRKGRGGVLGMGAEEARIIARLAGEKTPPENDETSEEASDVLARLLDYIGVEGTVNVTNPTDFGLPTTLNIEGDDLGVLIGRRGQALSALQYIVRLIMAEKTKTWTPLNVDVAGYKNRRYQSLRNLAYRLADQVKTSKRPINLEPMPADERRIIHLALADHPEVTTQSKGEGDKRKVVVQLKKR